MTNTAPKPANSAAFNGSETDAQKAKRFVRSLTLGELADAYAVNPVAARALLGFWKELRAGTAASVTFSLTAAQGIRAAIHHVREVSPPC